MDHQTPLNCALLEDLQLAIAEIFFCVHQLFQSGIVDDFQAKSIYYVN